MPRIPRSLAHRGRGGISDEAFWEFSKITRPGLFQREHRTQDEADSVITETVPFDPLVGVVRTSIASRDGRIIGIGRAGNPATMHDVDVNGLAVESMKRS